MIDRLQTLVLGRLATTKPAPVRELAKALARFAPPEVAPAAWAEQIDAACAGLGALAAAPAARDELTRRLGTPARTWASLVDRILPALALGIAADDAKSHQRLTGRDAWAAAIVARGLGVWAVGPPPSHGAVCDALVWRTLGLAGRAKRSPPEIRAHFVQRELQAGPGTVDWQVRMLAARLVAAPRAELRTLRDALVRRWLTGAALGPPDFAAEVGAVARAATGGLFGDRKVFIAAVWRDLRARTGWTELTLDAFKQQLVDAHRAGRVSLARADLVGAMDPELVAASETASQNARFHFVVREAP